ncbi:MAG TPA: LysM peptidoglycan-binding domain-containing protein, partial [Myxococcota bacterium]|nr:LysM peptidoglycan-binding domain-containing protein [Myxococcota bacterium]
MNVLAPRMHARTTAIVASLFAIFATSGALAEPHVVRKGQTLSAIAGRYGCKVSELKAENGLRGDGIRAGQKLVIPATCRLAPAASAEPDAGAKKTQAVKSKAKRLTHEVIDGETLEMISLRYGMSLEDLRKDNERALKKGLRPGLKLKILTSSEERAQRKISYTIESGDTLGGIARRFGMSTKDLMRMNPGKKPERLRIGDRLTIYKEGKVTRSQAVGRPQQGRLVNGEQMKDVPGAHFRRPLYTWGTNETVRALKAAIAEVRRKHKHAHDLVIGDLSREH